MNHGSFAVLAFLSAVLGGAVIHPLLLPYLPGRAFSTKGLFIGLIIAFFLIFMRGFHLLFDIGCHFAYRSRIVRGSI